MEEKRNNSMHYVYPLDLTEVEEELKCIIEKLRVSKTEAVKCSVHRHVAEKFYI